MRVASEAVARQAGIENGDLAAGTAELQGAAETGKTAADDVMTSSMVMGSVSWMEGVGFGLARNPSSDLPHWILLAVPINDECLHDGLSPRPTLRAAGLFECPCRSRQ
jgi:hypothetical protein